ncbi:hypothetical protein PVAND_015784 [Polypedilum vanderplanki]|uniref:Uncharacterized protein n=1 Tax=Polypedilum vanderplanki TaxID=319348 RepID=A0A9J6BDX0_POLVA|nr:hypothetical protein PVAND_015784 [Polypedilum vanderplanki]
MAKILYLISAVNSICWLLLFIYQIPPFIEAQDFISVYKRKEFVIESIKLLAYATGFITYLVLGCYKSCFDIIQDSFLIKFCTMSTLITLVLAYDGLTKGIYHYIAYAIVNFLCTIFVYKTIIHEWKEEIQNARYIDDNATYEKVDDENFVKIEM